MAERKRCFSQEAEETIHDMRLKLRKIGNSYGVLLPMELVLLFLEQGFVEVVLKDGDVLYDFKAEKDGRYVEALEIKDKVWNT